MSFCIDRHPSSVRPSDHPSVHNFKRLILWNREDDSFYIKDIAPIGQGDIKGKFSEKYSEIFFSEAIRGMKQILCVYAC